MRLNFYFENKLLHLQHKTPIFSFSKQTTHLKFIRKSLHFIYLGSLKGYTIFQVTPVPIFNPGDELYISTGWQTPFLKSKYSKPLIASMARENECYLPGFADASARIVSATRHRDKEGGRAIIALWSCREFPNGSYPECPGRWSLRAASRTMVARCRRLKQIQTPMIPPQISRSLRAGSNGYAR
jgi:hypothetical protein